MSPPHHLKHFQLPSSEVLSQRFHVVLGKGGVGKSTVAMTLGLYFAQQGLRTLICEIDDRETLTQAFGVSASKAEIRLLSDQLSVVSIDTQAALSEYGSLKLKVKALSTVLTENPLTRALISIVPGVADLIALGKAFNHERERQALNPKQWKWDRVIVDAPSTGHGLTFLRLPQVIRDVVPSGNMRQEADEMWALLSTPSRCCLHVVTTPEELPVQETKELCLALQSELDLQVQNLWINQMRTDVFDSSSWVEMKEALKCATNEKSSWLEEFFERNHELGTQQKLHLKTLDFFKGSRASLPSWSVHNLAELKEALCDTLEACSTKREGIMPNHRLDTRLDVFVGSGGVGKTTLSAAWALALAQQGLRVALITIDPAKRLAQALGLNRLSGELTQTEIHPRLWAMMLDRELTSYRLVETYSPNHDTFQKVIENRYFKAFSNALAGVQELMAIHEVYATLASGSYDVLVLDTPPAQHTLDLLEMPQRLDQALSSVALGWLLKSEHHDLNGSTSLRQRFTGLGKNLALKAFTKMTAGAFIEDLFEFLRLFGGVLTQIKDQGLSLEHKLSTEKAHIWIVSTPSGASLRQGLKLSTHLQERGLNVRSLLINRTPFLLTQAQLEEQELSSLLANGIEQLNQDSSLSLELKVRCISLLQEEFDRCQALSKLIKKMMSQRTGPTVITYVAEQHGQLSPTEHVSALSNQIKNFQAFKAVLDKP